LARAANAVGSRNTYVFDVIDVLGPAGRADILDAHFLGFLFTRYLYYPAFEEAST
jgi:hypothetical protein